MRTNLSLALLLLLPAMAGCTRIAGKDCGPKSKHPEGAPPELQLVSVDPDRSEMLDGYLLMSQARRGEESFVTVVNGCAEHIWWRPSSETQERIFRTHLSEDGTRVLYGEHNADHRPDTGMLYEVDIATDEIVRTTRTIEAHHDFAEVPGDEVAWISWQYVENQWFPGMEEDVVTDVIRTAPLGTKDETDRRLFSLADDLRGVTPWWSCSHMKPTDSIPGYAEWSHSNSLVYEPDRDRLYLFARHWDALLAIERESGSLAWMMGGPRDDLAATDGTELLVHAHLSDVWDGGLLAFDNRNHTGDGTSRVVELAWDEAGRTVEEVWSYEDGTFVGFQGDAQRLPGGNVLITWSPQGRITEVTREGDVVWEAWLSDGERLTRPEFHRQWPP